MNIISRSQAGYSDALTTFLHRPKQLLINNEWTDAQSSARVPVENPANGMHRSCGCSGENRISEVVRDAARIPRQSIVQIGRLA
jgi:hypothetical protein